MKQLRTVNAALAAMPAPTFKDPKMEILRLFREFEMNLRRDLEALPQVHGAQQSIPHLTYDLSNVIEGFQEEVARTTPRFYPWASSPPTSPVSDDDLDVEDSTGTAWHLDEVMNLAQRYIAPLFNSPN